MIRLTDPHRMSDFAGGLMRRVGPWIREHKLGRANLKAAFPEKSDAEIETILRRRLGQSRPACDRIRPSRPHLGSRPEQSRHTAISNSRRRARSASSSCATTASRLLLSPLIWRIGKCRRCPAPPMACRPPLIYRAPNIGAVSGHGDGDARSEYGPADQDRARRRVQSRRSTGRRPACRHAGRSVLCARRAGDVFRPHAPMPIR